MNTNHDKQTITAKDTAIKYGVPVGLIISSASAHAAIDVPDFSPLITFIAGLAASVAAIGMAVLSIWALAKGFKIVRGAF